MEKIQPKNIRNICLLGHSSGGKTSLCEAMLYMTKATDRLGKPTDGNTVCDYDDEEIKRGFSLSAAIAPVMWKNVKINMIDTPGYLDFVGEVKQGLRVADSALIVVDAKSGVEVGTELGWENAVSAKLPRAFFINKFDDPEANFVKVFEQLREEFGVSVCPVYIPMTENGKLVGLIDLLDMSEIPLNSNNHVALPEAFKATAEEYRNMLLESVAETSEELMEKFFGGEEITREEAINALRDGFANGDIAPVFCGSALQLWGIEALMGNMADLFPAPCGNERVIDGENVKSIAMSETAPAAAFVFKTIADPFVGKMSFFKVMAGTIKKDDTVKNLTNGQMEKLAHIYTIRGKKQTEVDELCTGDIGMTAKLADTNTNDTLAIDANALPYAKIEYPQSFMQVAIAPKAKGDEDKISVGINRLLEEDLTLKFENNAETKQLLLSGQGDIHIDVVVSKLQARFKTAVELSQPKIAYREAITKAVQAEGKHKKQSGGHGQYGHVKITFSPGDKPGLEFTESTFGGSVPKNFHPAVEKGLIEAMQKGVLAGFPVVNLKADLYDGSYHDVDSSEMAFKLAASLAYKEGLKNAKPVILEPIGKLMVYAPDSMLGDVMGAVNKRRGRVLGMTPTEKKGQQVVEAEAPMGEMSDFTVTLRALSQGRAYYTLEFDRYDKCPPEVAQKIIDERKKELEE